MEHIRQSAGSCCTLSYRFYHSVSPTGVTCCVALFHWPAVLYDMAVLASKQSERVFYFVVSNPPFCLWHFLNGLRQIFSKSLWQEEDSEGRCKSKASKHNIRQVPHVRVCSGSRGSCYGLCHCAEMHLFKLDHLVHRTHQV